LGPMGQFLGIGNFDGTVAVGSATVAIC
jgi:hypothetical protein